MTETKKKPVYWICDECGCEVPFSGNDSDTVCPSCGSRISSEKLTQVRRELNNANTPQSMIRNESSESVISDNDHRKYIYEDLVRLLNAILNSKLSAGKHPLPDYEVPKKEPDLMIQDGCLVRYNGSKNRVEIPSTVTSINPYAFSGCKTIREVVIPNEVKVIPRYAFENCTNLEKVILPKKLDTIETCAFKGCENLSEISLSPSIRTIEKHAFYDTGKVNYETMFTRPARTNTFISIADQWLKDEYGKVQKQFTPEKPETEKKKTPLYVYAIAAVLLIALISAINAASPRASSGNISGAQNRAIETEPSSKNSASVKTAVSSKQKEALSAAKDYLEYGPFSYARLVRWLTEYDGFAQDEAVYAADHCGADWNEQAVKVAHEDLEIIAFSYSHLVEWIVDIWEFTQDEAVYAADHCGADWYEQAVKFASDPDRLAYAPSYSEMVDFMISCGFTEDQAIYGAEKAFK